jgi:hypothetical protein
MNKAEYISQILENQVMYRKIVYLLSSLSILMTPMAAIPTYAAPVTYECGVVSVRILKNGNIQVNLTDRADQPSFKNKWFRVPRAAKREMFAASLSSLALGLQVVVKVDLATRGTPALESLAAKN